MVGTLAGIMAIGTGVSPGLGGGGTLSVQIGSVEPRPTSHTGDGALSAVRVMAFQRGAPFAGVGVLAPGVKQVYTKTSSLSGGGTLAGPDFFGTGFKDLAAAGAGVLAGVSSERYFSYQDLVGDGALGVASYKEIQTSPADLVGEGFLDANLMPNTQFIWRTDENVAASSQPRPASATAGVYVTLIGGGGGGRDGMTGARDHAKAGGGGGGGGAKVGRSFIPVANLGATYSVTRGIGSTGYVVPAAGTASTFTSGGITLTAGGGGGGTSSATAAAGGVASATGATVTLANGGAGPGPNPNSGTAPSAAANTNGAAAGGGAGAGQGAANTTYAGGAGGDTLVTTGNNGGTAGGGNGQTPTTVSPAIGGQGGGGGGCDPFGQGGAGGNGAAYGGGGGGSATGTGTGGGGDGAIGYTRLEWVGQMFLPTLAGDGALSATATRVSVPVAFNAVSTPVISGAPTSTNTVSHTAAGPDGAVLVWYVAGGTAAPTEATYGGVPMTLIVNRPLGSANVFGVFRLLDPPLGAQNGVVSWAASTESVITAISFINVGSFFTDVMGETSSGTATSHTVPSRGSTLNMLCHVFAIKGTARFTSYSGTTQRFSSAQTTKQAGNMTGGTIQNTGSSVVCSATASSSGWSRFGMGVTLYAK